MKLIKKSLTLNVSSDISNSLLKKQSKILLNLTVQNKSKVSLSSLIKDKIKVIKNLKKYKIKIMINQNSDIVLTDDLFDLGFFSSDIEFVLNENSNLTYSLKTDCLESCKDFCHECLKNSEHRKVLKLLKVVLVGSHSNADLKISFNGAGQNSFEIKTIQEHKASFTKSNLQIRSALSQFSTLLSDNIVKVDKGLKKIEANQDAKSLLFGCSARVISIPKLEVESDDVICKHGAAVSRLNDDHLFYLQSRGMDYCEAKDFLIKAFLN